MTKIEPARNPLRRARLAAGLELRDLEERTRISPRMLRHIDEGEFDRLPAGIYARAWVRSVAASVGLDPAEVIRDLEHALPPATAERADDRNPPDDKPGGSGPADRKESSFPVLSPARFFDRWRRSAAAALDGIFLSSISIAIWMATATAGGVDPKALGFPGVLAIGAITLAVAATYFVLFAGIGGRTPGAWLLEGPTDGERERLHLSEITRRAAHAALQESSIVVDLMIAADLPPAVERRVEA